MVETIQRNGLWHVGLAEIDLIKQAGLNHEDFEQDFGFFRYKKRTVIISHVFGEHLVVSIEGKEDADQKQLIDGFSKVVEYQPFCKYTLYSKSKSGIPPLPTYEWDKINPKKRLRELSANKNVSKLIEISSEKLKEN